MWVCKERSQGQTGRALAQKSLGTLRLDHWLRSDELVAGSWVAAVHWCRFDTTSLCIVADHVWPFIIIPDGCGLFRHNKMPCYKVKFGQGEFMEQAKMIEVLTWPPYSRSQPNGAAVSCGRKDSPKIPAHYIDGQIAAFICIFRFLCVMGH